MVIRLVKKGDARYHVYRIVVHSRDPVRRGGELTCLGFINPNIGQWEIVVDSQRLGLWMNRGVQIRSLAAKYMQLLAMYNR